MLYAMEVSEQKLKIVFSSVLKNISEVMEDAVEFLGNAGYAYESFSFKLALAEGLTNAVKHGNSMNPHLNAVFELDISKDKMTMSFEDQGSGFDWNAVLQRELPDCMQTSGRGLFLFNEYGYEILYNDAGNKLTLIKT